MLVVLAVASTLLVQHILQYNLVTAYIENAEANTVSGRAVVLPTPESIAAQKRAKTLVQADGLSKKVPDALATDVISDQEFLLNYYQTEARPIFNRIVFLSLLVGILLILLIISFVYEKHKIPARQ